MPEWQALTFGGHGLVEGEFVRCADFRCSPVRKEKEAAAKEGVLRR